jgi:hypothetical protein
MGAARSLFLDDPRGFGADSKRSLRIVEFLKNRAVFSPPKCPNIILAERLKILSAYAARGYDVIANYFEEWG